MLEASFVHLKRLMKTFAVVSDTLTHFNQENKVKEGQEFFHSYQDLVLDICIRYHL